jgi:hypothetical protein
MSRSISYSLCLMVPECGGKEDAAGFLYCGRDEGRSTHLRRTFERFRRQAAPINGLYVRERCAKLCAALLNPFQTKAQLEENIHVRFS